MTRVTWCCIKAAAAVQVGYEYYEMITLTSAMLFFVWGFIVPYQKFIAKNQNLLTSTYLIIQTCINFRKLILNFQLSKIIEFSGKIKIENLIIQF